MIILSACFAFVFVQVLQVHKMHRFLNRKPFSCEVCLAGWVALFACFHYWYTPLYMAGAMVATIVINKLIKA